MTQSRKLRLVALALLGSAGLLGAVGLVAAPAQPIHSSSSQPPLRKSRLISPMGSAANARPGQYQELLGNLVSAYPALPYYLPTVPIIYLDSQPAPPPPPQVVVVNNILPAPPPPVERYLPVETRPPAPEPEPVPRVKRPTAPQEVTFTVLPRDARLSIDSDKLEEKLDLGVPSKPMRLTPGVYVLRVVHPSHAPQRVVFGVDTEPVKVKVDLTADPADRARVR
jgi:hypothetical protein